MTGWRQTLIALAARRIPPAYREDITADLLERHRALWPLVLAILRSARDARKHMTDTTAEKPKWWTGWGADLRFAARQQWARPANAIAIVLVLAIAVGLNTAVFSMVRGVLLRPVAFADPGRVVFVWSTNNHGEREPMAPARAIDLRDRGTEFSGGALIGHLPLTMTGDGPPEQWAGASVSPSFFDVLGTPAAVGRTFTAADTTDAVVLSDRLWTERWQRDRSIIGRSIVLNGRPRVVVGVMPADFYWPSITPESSAINPPLSWTRTLRGEAPERPEAFDGDPDHDRFTGYVRMVARLRPGVSIEAAEAAVKGTAADLAREFPATDGAQSAILTPARDQLFGPVERPMLFIWLASAIVVLGACLNVGTLLLVKQTARRQEFAVRSALGADRARLVRQLLSETTLLALAGGALGVVMAKAALGALVASAPGSVGRLDQVAIDIPVLSAALALSIAAGLLLGALSAAALWRDRTATDLRTAGAAGGGHTRLRRGLVAAEVAVAMVLLVGTALFGESLLRLQHVDVGFNTRNLLTFDLALGPSARDDAGRQVAFFDRALERLRAIPGVRHAGAAVTLPIGGDDFGGRMYPEGRPLPAAGTEPRLGFQAIEPGWFETLGVRVVDGRDFTAGDRADTVRVVMVNKTLADELWPGQSPVGQRVRLSRAPTSVSRIVVGVVADVRSWQSRFAPTAIRSRSQQRSAPRSPRSTRRCRPRTSTRWTRIWTRRTDARVFCRR